MLTTGIQAMEVAFCLTGEQLKISKRAGIESESRHREAEVGGDRHLTTVHDECGGEGGGGNEKMKTL